MYFSKRDYWNIENIKCDYVYWDAEREERTPKDRDFSPGEFEELYKWRSLDDFEKLIQRSIEFPEEYFEAGKSILSYFGTVLRKKYSDTKASVQIKQDGLKVTMIIDPKDGNPEVIEKALNEYGLVVTGNMSPEEYTDDRLLRMELQTQLNFAKAQIENQKLMLQYRDEDIKKKDIQIDRFLSLMECAMSRDVIVKNEIIQHQGDRTDIKANGDVAFAKNQGKNNMVKNAQAGIIGDSAQTEGGTHFSDK